VNRLENAVSAVAHRMGLSISRLSSQANRLPIEATDADRAIIDFVRPYTMTSAERVWSLLQAVRYATDEALPGDFVECGVWRGGSVMAMARQLTSLGTQDRTIWLYDTFQGMTAPTEKDVEAASGITASELLAATEVGDGNNVWCVASQDDVERNLRLTGYPMDRFRFVRGDVAETLKSDVPDQIAILRLDTDWYESTKVGLEVLYPRLVVGGVCIFDDYGHWQGARRAADEYFAERGIRPFMHPIDFSGRVFIKTR
jgi:O-methyltransferase